ncbi:hypothetical protein D918_00780 [Trichuris suis]|nr:hypothetical protein D918_00780 [Trichuris suis]
MKQKWCETTAKVNVKVFCKQSHLLHLMQFTQ